MASSEKPSTSQVILTTLMKSQSPLNLYKLAKKSKLSHQRIKYALPRLVEAGLVLPLPSENSFIYTIQKIHLQRDLIDSILVLIEPLIKKIYSELNLECVLDQERALANNVALFISNQVVNVR